MPQHFYLGQGEVKVFMKKITSREDLERYLSGDRLECFICGKSYINLGTHIGYGHKVDIKEYKEKYGIPTSVGLLSEPFKKNKSDNASNNPLIKKGQFKKGHETKLVKKRKQPDWCYKELIKNKPIIRKLSPDEILEIYSSGEAQIKLAKKYGVGVGTINRIKKRNHWFFKGKFSKTP